MTRPQYPSPAATAMAERHRAFAWEATPIGPAAGWDPALQALLPVVLASLQPMFVAWGPQRTLLYNDAFAALLADRHPAALGQDLLDGWPGVDGLAGLLHSAWQGRPGRLEDVALLASPRGARGASHADIACSPVPAASGGVGGVLGICHDTSAKLHAERRHVRSEARYRRLLENTDLGFTLFDRDFRILDANPAALRLVGLPLEELVGSSHWERFPGTLDSPLGRLYRQALAEQRSLATEHCHRFADGREQWFDVRAFPVEDGLAVLFQDMSERHRLQEELSVSFERIQLALDAGAIVGTWVWNIAEDRVLADERFAQSFGLDPERMREGAPIQWAFDAIHPDDRPRVQEAVARAVSERSRYRCEYRVLRDGAYRWVEGSGRVEVDADGAPVRFPGVLLDIEERRRAEDERDRVAALLATFIEAVPGVVYAKDREGRYLVANRGTARVLGLAVGDIVGRADDELLPDRRQAEEVMRRDRAVMASGRAVQAEESVARADGTRSIWWSVKEPLRDGQGEVVGLVGASVDITDRKAMEDALRRSEERSALAMEVAELGAWEWDVRTGAVTADDRCRRICGLDRAPPTFTLAEVRERVHPDDWERVELALTRALEAGRSRTYAEEFRWVHADGRTVWTATRGRVQVEDADGRAQAVGMLGSVTDITERRKLIEALQRADRRKDEFLAMLAHELRNPLAPIKTAAHALGLSGRPDERRVREAGAVISRQVGHLTRLVDDLLDVSRVTRGLVELAREPVDLRSVVSTAVEQVRPLLQARRHELSEQPAAGPVVVKGDFHRLVQVVSNLLNNAAKYTPPGGRIEVWLRTERGRAVLGVSDDGVGIAPEMLDQVFELFTQAERTPDRSQGGLGIGLALVRSLVQLHHGEVRASSAGLQQGSTFRVELPLSAEARRPAPRRLPARAAAAGQILVVDDNADAAATLAEVLRLVGHRVTTAPDARTALDTARREARWDAFILDIGLPDMTGHELARRLRESPAASGATFVALTGYGQAHDRLISRTSGFDHHLVKPADVSLLIDILTSAIAGPQAGARHGVADDG